MMAKEAIVKFDPCTEKYKVYVLAKKGSWFRADIWECVQKENSYSRSEGDRTFPDYEKAKIFAMKCSVEVKVQHKHDVKITDDRL